MNGKLSWFSVFHSAESRNEISPYILYAFRPWLSKPDLHPVCKLLSRGKVLIFIFVFLIFFYITGP